MSSPVTDGLRNQNDEMRQKARFYAGCALHHMMQSGPKTLRTSSYDEVRKTQVFPSFFSALNHFVISSRAKGKAARTGHGPKRGPLASRPQKTPPPQKRRSRLPPRSVLNGPHRGPGPRIECPGTGRGRALAVSTGAAVAAAPKRGLSSPVTDGLREENGTVGLKPA